MYEGSAPQFPLYGYLQSQEAGHSGWQRGIPARRHDHACGPSQEQAGHQSPSEASFCRMSTEFVYPVIDMCATGTHIKELMTARELSVQDVQDAMGLASPQAVYRWLCGSNLPSVDNLYALSRFLDVPMNNVIVEKAA